MNQLKIQVQVISIKILQVTSIKIQERYCTSYIEYINFMYIQNNLHNDSERFFLYNTYNSFLKE